MDGENGKKAIVYNTEEEKRKRKKGEKEKEKNRKNCVLTSDSTRAYPRIPFVLI